MRGFTDGFKYVKSHIDAAEGGVYDPPTREAIRDYLQAGQAYPARAGQEAWNRKGDYDHLSRFGEWDLTDAPVPVNLGPGDLP